MKDFDAPFLILHGKDDKVTSPELSQIMYHESISMDKEIILYDGEDENRENYICIIPLLLQKNVDIFMYLSRHSLFLAGMWHSITCAEPDEDIDRVFRDASEWMLKRL